MKRLTSIMTLLVLLLTLQHNVGASTTVQTQDIIIIDKVKHRVNQPLMFQIDSAVYFSLKEKLDFGSSTFSWNFRGHVATFVVKGNKLYLNNIESSFKTHSDFNGLLDRYMDREGRVFASWITGTLICGSGACLNVEQNGFDSVYEKETELVVEAGVIISSRSYSNKAQNHPGTVTFDEVKQQLPKEFDYDRFPELKGRVTVQICPSAFNDEGKIMDWSLKVVTGHVSDVQAEKIFTELKRVLNRYEWKTFMRDGIWYWRTVSNIPFQWPLIFK